METNRLPVFALGLALIGIVSAAFAGRFASHACGGQKVAGELRFQDVTAQAGIAFRFETGSRGKHDLPEIMGGGVGLIDVDGDGHLDVYFCNGGPIDSDAGRPDPPSRLYRNRGDGTYIDITTDAGAPGPSYAMGVAVGDIDGDGRDDLFVTGWREQRLYRNLGGRFEDVTATAGLSSTAWSTSAAFADLDGDGDLDLYVANYLEFDARRAPYCAAPDGKRDFCGPEDFPAQADRLYRNDGQGRFSDVSREAGILDRNGRGLGVLIAELTGDDRPDIFVANDGTPCYLFQNLGGLKFEDVAQEAGVAVDGQGGVIAGMGVALGDVNDDGLLDLVIGNLHGRTTVLFVRDKPALYQDASTRWALPALTRRLTGFGVALEDFDGDGRLDLFQTNGHVLDRARLGVPFAMRPLVLRNSGSSFVDVSGAADAWFDRPILGRGLAIGDLDGDGRPDVVVNALDAPAAVLRNVSTGGHFLNLNLVGRRPSPLSAIGSRVRVQVGGRVLNRELVGGGSYLSASSRTLCVGLGEATRAERVEVTWPSGKVEAWLDVKADATVRVEEGSGRASGPR
jgi:hypothetical protein